MISKYGALAILSGLTVANVAAADYGPRTRTVYVPVLDVEPVVREVMVRRPREECWLETAIVPDYRAQRRAAGAAIAGGLIGGVIGHQFGSGRGNDAMTLIGTLVGSAVASDAAHRRSANAGYGREVTTERCEMVTESYPEERIDGYRVTYEYMGQRYETVMPQPPRGDRVRLHVTVETAAY